jgi:subtilisin family serine protease
VLTVGASSHNGTVARNDDTVAAFSSRGPTYIDYAAKPDLVAPGVGIESLTDQSTVLYAAHPAARLWGTMRTATEPYSSLSGTSMAAPVVTGTIALMLQANPSLTPNLVKAILQFTAEHNAKYDDLTQGAGFLNARGAVQLARDFAAGAAASPDGTLEGGDQVAWNRHINWGNRRIGGGMIRPDANAWATGVVWGATATDSGEPISWGIACKGNAACDSINWRASGDSDSVAWAATTVDGDAASVWGTNVVWGTACGGEDCVGVMWGANCDSGGESTGAAEECDNVVWGTNDVDEADNVVWGTKAPPLPE